MNFTTLAKTIDPTTRLALDLLLIPSTLDATTRLILYKTKLDLVLS